MEFHCTHCGCKLAVPEAHRGKKGRCPKCKETLIVPNTDVEQKSSLHDMRLLDLPQPDETESSTSQSDESAAAYEQLRGSLGGRIMDPEEPPERKYPWIIDIFLYPLNFAALTMLLICVGGPFLLRVMVIFAKVAMIHVPVMLIIWFVFIVVHWVVELLLGMYVIWYFFACVRDSAEGGIRAPNTTAMTPGLWDLLLVTFRLLACAALCVLPVALCAFYRGQADPLCLVLTVLGGLVFPMALLSVVMHESVNGLNPLLVLRSILRTPVHYLLLVPFCYALSRIIPLAFGLILDKQHWHWSYVLQAASFYQTLVVAHLLGRFYFKNEEKLEWDA